MTTGTSSGDDALDAWALELLEQQARNRTSECAARILVGLAILAGPIVAASMLTPWWLVCLPAAAVIAVTLFVSCTLDPNRRIEELRSAAGKGQPDADR